MVTPNTGSAENIRCENDPERGKVAPKGGKSEGDVGACSPLSLPSTADPSVCLAEPEAGSVTAVAQRRSCCGHLLRRGWLGESRSGRHTS